MTRRTNIITPIAPESFANMILDDRDNHAWMACHLVLQLVAYLDDGAGNTAPAHYTRQALLALRRGNLEAYNDALDELLTLLGNPQKQAEDGE